MNSVASQTRSGRLHRGGVTKLAIQHVTTGYGRTRIVRRRQRRARRRRGRRPLGATAWATTLLRALFGLWRRLRRHPVTEHGPAAGQAERPGQVRAVVHARRPGCVPEPDGRGEPAPGPEARLHPTCRRPRGLPGARAAADPTGRPALRWPEAAARPGPGDARGRLRHRGGRVSPRGCSPPSPSRRWKPSAIAATGVTVLLVEQGPQLPLAYADRVLGMVKGRLVSTRASSACGRHPSR